MNLNLRYRPVLRSCAALLTVAAPLSLSVASNGDAAVNSGLVEKIEARRVQIDVTVRGPAQALTELTAEDFEVVVGRRMIERFELDPLCDALPPPLVAVGEPGSINAPATADEGTGLNLLFYFDQFHLKEEGRRNSLELARGLVRELIVDGNRATIVSSARDVRTFADWTSDPDELLDALDRLEKDRLQFDEYASGEEFRVQRVLNAVDAGSDLQSGFANALAREMGEGARISNQFVLADKASQASGVHGSPDATQSLARQAVEQQGASLQGHAAALMGWNVPAALDFAEMIARDLQREEQYHARRGTIRIANILKRFIGVPAPKAMVYFGDTLRANPGDHYWRLLPIPESERMFPQVLTAIGSQEYEEVINEATSHGVRIYSVQAEGLTGGSLLAVSLASQPILSADPLGTRARYDDAKNGLAGFALETGGQVFFGGADADLIAMQILRDLSCIYLISFEPKGLPTDRPLQVSIYTNRPKLRVQHRARVFVRTASGHLRSELIGAFVRAEGSSTSDDLHVVVIPTGFESGRYTTLVQAVVTSTLPSAAWDLGITAVSKRRVRDSASGRLAVDSPSPVVLEAVMSFPPGPYEITAVAHETTMDRVIHQRIEGEWPEPGDAPASIGPIALLQPVRGAFLRAGEVRRHGSLGYSSAQWVQPERAAGLVGIICRGRGNRHPLTVTRRLRGDSAAEFDPWTIEASEGRCAVFGDLIRENTMTSGKFTYEVRVTGEDGELATSERSFFAVSPDDIQVAGQ